MLSDILKPRVCELGKIKIGEKGKEHTTQKGGSYRAPVKLNHFKITTMQKDNSGDYIPDVALMDSLSQYADPDGKLRQLPVAVLSNDIEEIMQVSYLAYQGKRLAARSDGKTLVRFFDSQSNKWLNPPEERAWVPDWAEREDDKGNKLFKLHTTLNVVIAAPQARWGGVYKFRSTSQITAEQLYSSLKHLQSLTGGFLRGLPLFMVLRPVQVSPKGKTTTVHVVHMELRGPDLQAIQQQAVERARLELENRRHLEVARLEYKAMLAAPLGEDEEGEIGAEFHPEQVADATASSREESPVVDPLAAQLGIVEEPQQPELVAKIRWYLNTYDMTDIESDEIFKAGLSAQKVEELSPADQEKFWEYLNRDITVTE